MTKKLIARAKVLATAAVTWLVVAGGVATELANDLGKVGPVGAVAARWAARAAIWAATAISILRRVTPVLDKAERGLLPSAPDN